MTHDVEYLFNNKHIRSIVGPAYNHRQSKGLVFEFKGTYGQMDNSLVLPTLRASRKTTLHVPIHPPSPWSKMANFGRPKILRNPADKLRNSYYSLSS